LFLFRERRSKGFGGTASVNAVPFFRFEFGPGPVSNTPCSGLPRHEEVRRRTYGLAADGLPFFEPVTGIRRWSSSFCAFEKLYRYSGQKHLKIKKCTAIADKNQ